MSVFTIKEIESFSPGANPMIEDFENMGTSLGENVMVLHKTFPHEEMTWMVLVHIPSGERILISFPEDVERLYSPEEMCDILDGKEEGTGSTSESLPTSAMPTSILGEKELKESLNALLDIGIEAKIKKMYPAATRPKPYVKGGEDE